MAKAKKSAASKTVNVSTRIDKTELEQLLTIAEEERRNLAQIVRFAISEFLDRRKVAA